MAGLIPAMTMGGGAAMNSLVIARSDSDEAIQPALAARYELDCFASLAMTM